MPPTEIPANRAAPRLRSLAQERRPSSSVCNCGHYGFKSTTCSHSGIEDEVKCGLTLSEITGRPIFCIKKPPHITLPEHVVPEPCKQCERNNSVSQSSHLSASLLEGKPLTASPSQSQLVDANKTGPGPTRANTTAPSASQGAAQEATKKRSNKSSAKSGSTRSLAQMLATKYRSYC